MTKLRVGIVVPAFFYVPYWLALARGWYGEFGLDVEIVDMGGIVEVTKALKSGEIQIGVGSPEHVIHDAAAGGDLRMFGGNVNRLTHSLIVQPEIERIEDLRGKTIGVSALNAGTSSLFIDLLARHGLQPGDYRVVGGVVVPPRHDMLMRREIDAAMQTDPHNYMAEDAGLRNLGLVADWIPYFQFTSLNARQSWADRHPEEMLGFLRATLRGSALMTEDAPSAIEVAAGHQLMDRRYLQRAWEDHVSGAVPVDLHLDRRSIATDVEMMRRDREAALAIPDDDDVTRYVSLELLARAQAAEGLPMCTLV
ncbi:ABC transporter substrate-binding protein [Variovorax sp. J31P207]|uniref:ABC transporter substrate-binding protein n=1 Tax=Variovorax sp. J31P207 TaxID=3053510 RepID=UPI002576EAA4|nr:ABC transporter substrate-binding protein [Variovorax sp. J31P207]MDM0066964.1 ABC transporter substrate-binding protein [Variovorax sp. J31P207]